MKQIQIARIYRLLPLLLLLCDLPGSSSAEARVLTCPADMVPWGNVGGPGSYCIDSDPSGPWTSYEDAITYCAAKGRNLCNVDEEMAGCNYWWWLNTAPGTWGVGYEMWDMSFDEASIFHKNGLNTAEVFRSDGVHGCGNNIPSTNLYYVTVYNAWPNVLFRCCIR